MTNASPTGDWVAARPFSPARCQSFPNAVNTDFRSVMFTVGTRLSEGRVEVNCHSYQHQALWLNCSLPKNPGR